MLRRVLLLGLAAAFLALPTSASAATRSQSFTLTANNQEATLVPTCPRGQRATGGGFLAPPPGPGADAKFYESRKSGQRSWRVSVFQNGAGTLPVTAYVYCDKDAPKTKTKMATVPVTPGVFSTAEVSCASAGKAQAGGFSSPAPASGISIDILESFRSAKKSWRSRGRFVAGSPTLTTYVYCADAGSPKARSGSTSTSMSNDLITALSAPCKGGTHAGAGGFSQPTAAITSLYIFPYESFRVGKSWRAAAFHAGGTSTTLTATAYCT